jgi:hypothetical protein
LRPLKNALFYPIFRRRRRLWRDKRRQAQILILEILIGIPVVRILAFPRSKSGIFDLTLNKIEQFSKVSPCHGFHTIDGIICPLISNIKENLLDLLLEGVKPASGRQAALYKIAKRFYNQRLPKGLCPLGASCMDWMSISMRRRD